MLIFQQLKQGMVVVIDGMLIDVNFSAIETRYGSGYRWNVS